MGFVHTVPDLAIFLEVVIPREFLICWSRITRLGRAPLWRFSLFLTVQIVWRVRVLFSDEQLLVAAPECVSNNPIDCNNTINFCGWGPEFSILVSPMFPVLALTLFVFLFRSLKIR